MLLRVQVIPEQWLLSRDTRRANLAVASLRVLLVVAEDSVRHVLLRLIVLKSVVLLHDLQLLVAIPRLACLLNTRLHEL